MMHYPVRRLAFAGERAEPAPAIRRQSTVPLPQLASAFLINGRFYGQRLTGVQRYAREIVAGLDQLLAQSGRTAEAAVLPGMAEVPAFEAIVPKEVGIGAGHLWEQAILPWSLDVPLLGLCNTGPALVRRQTVCIHDTNVFTEPGSYQWWFRLFYRALQSRLACRAFVATVSQASAQAIARQFDVPLGHIAVLPNGHEHALRWRPDRAQIGGAIPSRPFVLLLGSRARHKNTGLLIRLAEALNGLGLDLVMTGQSSAIFAGETEGCATPQNLHHLGRVDDDDLALLFSRALCLAFPSLTEGFGLPIVEAMVHGCPVISSDRASLPEVCGGAALLAAPDDPAAWLSHIAALRDSHGLRQELADKGRAQARQFSWTASARGYLELMDRLA